MPRASGGLPRTCVRHQHDPMLIFSNFITSDKPILCEIHQNLPHFEYHVKLQWTTIFIFTLNLPSGKNEILNLQVRLSEMWSPYFQHCQAHRSSDSEIPYLEAAQGTAIQPMAGTIAIYSLNFKNFAAVWLSTRFDPNDTILFRRLLSF